jgi:uncharacterized protein
LLEVFLAALVVAFIGSFAQAVSGFGFAVVAVPLLAFFVDTSAAVVGITAQSALLTIGAAYRYRHDVDWTTTTRFSIAAVLGMPLGLVALATLDSPTLALVVACAVIVFATLTLSNVKFGSHPRYTYGAGFMGGVFLTTIGMNGPPFVFALQGLNFAPQRMRATLQASFAIQDVLAMIGFAIIAQVSVQMGVIVLGGIPGLILGWIVGNRLFAIIPAAHFRWIVGLTLLGSAVALAVKGIAG